MPDRNGSLVAADFACIGEDEDIDFLYSQRPGMDLMDTIKSMIFRMAPPSENFSGDGSLFIDPT